MLCNINTSTVYPCVYREHEIEQDADITLLRFIPVCTGNIYNALMNYVKSTVYPCVYREHSSGISSMTASTGLSLCVQGTLGSPCLSCQIDRFIPVCTGNIKDEFASIKTISVYPCVYREHLIVLQRLKNLAGLSLCVQGTYQL